MTSRLPDNSTMDSSHITTLHLPDLSNQASEAYPHLNTIENSPTNIFRILCDDGYTITLDKQDMSVHKNVQETIKGT